MGRYDIAPYMRGGGKRVRVRVRRWTCECITETGGGPEGPAPHRGGVGGVEKIAP